MLMRIRLQCLLVLTAVIVPLFCAGGADAETAGPSKEYVVIGTSRIYKGNTANARQAAIDDGLTAAVAEAVVELVPNDHLVGHFTAVCKAVGDRSEDFLQGYKVLTETPVGDDYRVLVAATVSLEALRRQFNSAGVTLSRKAMPRTLLLVVEKDMLQPYPAYWWGGDHVMTVNGSQRVLAGTLRDAGFSVLPPSQPPAGNAPVLDYPPNIDLEIVMQLARAYGAEVVVVGAAQAALAPNTMGDQMRSYRAVVGIKALRVEDRKPLAAVEQDAVVTASDDAQGVRKALDGAALPAGEALARQLAAAWLVSEDVLNPIEITIEGIRDLANFVMFRRVVKQMPGVKSIQTREMKPDQATLVVTYQGDAAALADGIMRTTFDPFSIDITDVSEGKMRLALIPR